MPKDNLNSRLAEFFHAQKSFLFAKGRVGLYAGLRAMELPRGAEVLMPGYTCMVVPSATQFAGLKPVYVDIDPKTYNVAPKLLKQSVSPDIAAIIVQHTYGIPCDMTAVEAWASPRDIAIIEDCCHVFGSLHSGRLCGTFGQFAFMSGQWNKPFSTGLGGMLLVNDAVLADAVERLVEKELKQPGWLVNLVLRCQIAAYDLLVHPATAMIMTLVYRAMNSLRLVKGSSSPDELRGVMPADYFTAMAPCQMRRGLQELARIDENISHRIKLTAFYHAELSKLGFAPLAIRGVPEMPLLRYPVRVANKSEVLQHAVTSGVEIGSWFECPLHPQGTRQEDFGYQEGMCPEAERAASEAINLPTHLKIDMRTAEHVLLFLQRCASPVSYDSSGPQQDGEQQATVVGHIPHTVSLHRELPSVSIVIPCRNEALRMRKCLECVVDNNYPKDRLEVLIIDGMSDDGTRQIIEEFRAKHPYIRMIDNPKRITPAALNCGIRESHGEILVRMDVHAEYPADYVASLVRWLLTSEADNVGGVCITYPAKDGVLARAIAIGMSHPVGGRQFLFSDRRSRGRALGGYGAVRLLPQGGV